MSGQDLFLELQEKMKLLDIALDLLPKRGQTAADTERIYRVELAKEEVIERANGLPATILSDVCRGKPTVAKLKFDRDVAWVNYKAAMEAINVYKIECKMINEQINREWNRA